MKLETMRDNLLPNFQMQLRALNQGMTKMRIFPIEIRKIRIYN